MKLVKTIALALVATAIATHTASAGPALAGPPPANAFIVFGGLDWAWASPCNNDCSTITLGYGFRYATASEFAARPDATDFLDPSGNFGGFMRCASPYFDNTYSHCDYSDGASGYIASGPGVGAPPGGVQETWLVRDSSAVVPEPATFALMGTGLVGLVGIARRRKVA